MAQFRVIQGCPINETIAPYVAILVTEARATVNSLYRGADAAEILHKHGHRTQAEVFAELGPGVANPPGISTHELHSDGVAYPGHAKGAALPWWCQGIDVNDGDTDRMIQVAHGHGWELFRPYPGSKVEFHHVNFKQQPGAKDQAMTDRLIQVRHSLPTS